MKTTKRIGISQLRAEHVQEYISVCLSEPKARSTKKSVTHVLRVFFRFLFLRELIRKRLDEAVPRIIVYKASYLPSFLSKAEIRRLLKAPDRRTEAGRRDYAMLLLMARYGVRLLNAKWLRLRDVDWRKKTITFSALKNGKMVVVPLLPDVAKALLDYIRIDRGNDPQPEIFLTIRNRGTGGKRHGRRPLSYFNHMSQFRRYYEKANIKSRQKASHILRHSFATNLLRDEVPIKHISDLLGHRHLDTTQIYAKVDIESLRSIVSPWPETRL
jgi:integrase/recombinase XerD